MGIYRGIGTIVCSVTFCLIVSCANTGDSLDDVNFDLAGPETSMEVTDTGSLPEASSRGAPPAMPPDAAAGHSLLDVDYRAGQRYPESARV